MLRHVFVTCLLLLTMTLSSQNRKFVHYVGKISATNAEVMIIADTVREVHFWKAFTLSDHEGDKEIEDAKLVSKKNDVHIYKLEELVAGTAYEFVIIYRDTFIRDTLIAANKTKGNAEVKAAKEITVNGHTYLTKELYKTLFARRKEE